MQHMETRKIRSSSGHLDLRTIVYTAFALGAFAANSVICRLALGDASIDAASFAAVRLVSGALVLMLIIGFSGTGTARKSRGTWTMAAMLFVYAVTFSFAYISLTTGTGALILFGSVQATMILAGLFEGERFGWLQWAGLVVALSGLIYLVLPGWQAPTLSGAALMTAAGVAWGVYSLLGRGVANPIAVTGDNFLRSVPMVLVVGLAAMPTWNVSLKGVLLAFVSGAVTSGLGYVVWYAALRELTATRAATAQLLVPVIAALGGVVLLSEPVSPRLVMSSIMIIGGVGLIFLLRNRSKASNEHKKINVQNKGVCNEQSVCCSAE
jgi:drug/metabolite transporter (DMT)-like permease